MKRLSFYLFLCAVLLMSVNVFGQFAGGSGTLADPYQVADASQFTAIANSDAFFVQTADITFDESTDFPKILGNTFFKVRLHSHTQILVHNEVKLSLKKISLSHGINPFLNFCIYYSTLAVACQ